jgi:5-methylcytosine-specific restriction endonuclease McrA
MSRQSVLSTTSGPNRLNRVRSISRNSSDAQNRSICGLVLGGTTSRYPNSPFLPRRGLSGVCHMEFVASLQNATRKIRTMDISSFISLCPQPVQAKQTDASMNPSKMRLHVVRRDHYRCTGCRQMGDEVTLDVRRIQPAASNSEEMLTLCVHCRRPVEQWNIAASIGLEFLQHLRCQLHPTTATQSQSMTNKGRRLERKLIMRT